MDRYSRSARLARRATPIALAALAVLASASRVAAHAGGVRAATRETVTVPTWLFLATGGAVVGASFLLASAVTDRSYIRRIDGWTRALPDAGRVARVLARTVGLAALAVTIAAGLFGPRTAADSAAVLVVWVGWWAVFVLSAYLLGNAWPAVDPFRAIAGVFPSLDRPYPERLGSWPAVAGLLALVYLEVVTPMADDPRLLTGLVLGYLAVSVTGSVVFGADDWFDTADPVSRLLDAYGRAAPITRTDDGPRLRVPGMGLTDAAWIDGHDDVGFVVAIVFVTTYDGFVGTGLWTDIARPFVEAGVPALLVYLLAMLIGYGLFLGLYLASARAARRTADTFLAPGELARRFAPSLLAIAAGYHLAHNLATALSLSPTLAAVLTSPLSPPEALPVLIVPGWVGAVGVAAVLGGHLLAVWVAHATAYDLFPDRLQAIRSQYGVTVAMVAYTMASLWIVSRPGGAPPFV
ncbi:hypothetical protein [Halobaculum magnesiiphilum]|uniref:Uncharacterized protein n=1 Tax=Halobaculum magnesiiphilum TaxID=1017351 RepID=A0A8T8WG14_9EURY|nr:hypothetical protein [Halobaculum magnesiiphilum]QZP38684.1 hypothetical protein K6T50_05975 [Halobaculum magnesiiphilum]